MIYICSHTSHSWDKITIIDIFHPRLPKWYSLKYIVVQTKFFQAPNLISRQPLEYYIKVLSTSYFSKIEFHHKGLALSNFIPCYIRTDI